MQGWLLIAILAIIAILIGCQSAVNGTPLSMNNGSQVGNGLTLTVTQPVDESVVRSNPVKVSGSTVEGAEITINGISVTLEGTRFTAQIEMEEGPNSIEVIASDRSGKQTYKYLTVVYIP